VGRVIDLARRLAFLEDLLGLRQRPAQVAAEASRLDAAICIAGSAWSTARSARMTTSL
jgi:hypothetical protein